MATHHIPKGVSLDTLREVIVGWDTVGAAAEPEYTAAVEDATGISDAVGRQTRFLEDVGVLAADGQKHRLTERGKALAGALAVDEDERARSRARELLADWPVTEGVRGIVDGNPSTEAELVPLVAAITGHDPDASRVRSGITTLLAFYDWAGLLDRDDEGRYRLPENERSSRAEAADSVADEREASAAAGRAAVESEELEPAVEPVAEPEPGAGEGDATAEAGDANAGEDVVAGAAGDAATDGEPTAVPGEAIEALVEATEASDVESLVEEVAAATDAETNADGDSSGGGEHALSLEVDLDADPEDLEVLVGSIRRGLTGENGDDEQA